MSEHAEASDPTRAADAARGRRFEYFTLGWNVIEAAVAIGAGVLADSIASWASAPTR